MKTEARHFRVDQEILAGDEVFAVIAPLHWGVDIYSGPDAYERTLARFSTPQRMLLAINWYRHEVNNGGHDQFYTNSTGIVWKDALEAFRAIGLLPLADVLEESASRLGGSPSLDRAKREDALDDLEPSFEDLDDRFYDLEKEIDLDRRLLEYARSRPTDFYFDGVVQVPK